jgi:ribosomal protein S18 acetylase RimI-like enzyme
MWLHRHGCIYGDPNGNYAAVIKAATDIDTVQERRLWVAEACGEILGALTIGNVSDQAAHLLWLCVAPGWRAELLVAKALLQTATAHARAMGYLKLILHAHLASAEAARLFHDLGFAFSRQRLIGGMHVFEFYLDLYKQQPHLEDSRAGSRSPHGQTIGGRHG